MPDDPASDAQPRQVEAVCVDWFVNGGVLNARIARLEGSAMACSMAAGSCGERSILRPRIVRLIR